ASSSTRRARSLFSRTTSRRRRDGDGARTRWPGPRRAVPRARGQRTLTLSLTVLLFLSSDVLLKRTLRVFVPFLPSFFALTLTLATPFLLTLAVPTTLPR